MYGLVLQPVVDAEYSPASPFAGDPRSLVGCRVAVWSDLHRRFYPETVVSYDPATGKHTCAVGAKERAIALADSKFRVLSLPTTAATVRVRYRC